MNPWFSSWPQPCLGIPRLETIAPFTAEDAPHPLRLHGWTPITRLPHMFHIGCKTYEDTQQELKNGGLVDDFPFPPKYLWGSKFVLQRCMMGDFYSNILRLEYSPLKLAVSSWKIPPRPFQKEIHRIPTIGIFWVSMLVYPKGSWEVGKMSHALARWAMPWLCTVVL